VSVNIVIHCKHCNTKRLEQVLYGVLRTRFGSLELKIGSLESEIIGSLESEKSGPYRSIPGT